MLAGPGFIFSGDADGAFAANRAFVFANSAANTAFGVDIGLLEPYLNRHSILRLRWVFKWEFTVNRQTAGCIGDDLSAPLLRVPRDNTKIISGGILICNQHIALKLDSVCIGRFNNQRMLDVYGIE